MREGGSRHTKGIVVGSVLCARIAPVVAFLGAAAAAVVGVVAFVVAVVVDGFAAAVFGVLDSPCVLVLVVVSQPRPRAHKQTPWCVRVCCLGRSFTASLHLCPCKHRAYVCVYR